MSRTAKRLPLELYTNVQLQIKELVMDKLTINDAVNRYNIVTIKKCNC